MRKKILLCVLLFSFYKLSFAQIEGLIVNEISNGLSGSKEYVELLVIGCAGGTVDLRGWVIDDNNGDFGGKNVSGEGIAPGHVRFTNATQWSNVPVGSLIVIYNDADKNENLNNSFSSDDPSDSNNDKVYVLNLQSKSGANFLFEKKLNIPSASSNAYTGGSYVDPTSSSWDVISMSNTRDGMQTRKPNYEFFHGVCYGYTSGSIGVRKTGNGSKKVFLFENTNDDDYNKESNFEVKTADNTTQTPGEANGAKNQTYITTLRTSTGGVSGLQITNTITSFCSTKEVDLEATNTGTVITTGKWTSDKTTATFTSGTSNKTKVTVSTAGTYKFTWTVCGGTVSKTFIFIDPPKATITAASEVCGLTTPLKGDNTPGASITSGIWNVTPSAGVTFGNANFNNTNVTVPKAGIYKFKWTVGPASCQGTSEEKTIVFSDENYTPQSSDIAIKKGKSGQLDVTFSGTAPASPNYSWSPTTGLSNPSIKNPVASPSTTTKYTVTIKNGACSKTVEVTVKVTDEAQPEIAVPNIFTPNGDGVNDSWSIIKLTEYPNSIIKVYNRWGNIVFESKGYTKAWNGTYNGKKVPTGTYYYVIDPKNGGNPKPLKGSVTITY